jgi:hypothetical protein
VPDAHGTFAAAFAMPIGRYFLKRARSGLARFVVAAGTAGLAVARSALIEDRFVSVRFRAVPGSLTGD